MFTISLLSLFKKMIVVCLMLSPLWVHATGFNCANAKTFIDKTICADARLSMLDADLNTVFREAQSEMSGVDGETGKRMDPVGAEQKQWIRKIRNKCQDKICLVNVYEKRIASIKQNWLDK